MSTRKNADGRGQKPSASVGVLPRAHNDRPARARLYEANRSNGIVRSLFGKDVTRAGRSFAIDNI